MKKNRSMSDRACYSSGNTAFSLVEILVVLAIVGILTGLMAPALSGITQARSLEKAGADIMGTLDAARTYAMSQNTYVWVGFAPATDSSDDLLVGVVASSTGNGSPDASDVVPIARTKRFRNIQLTALDAASAANRPDPAGQLANATGTTLNFTVQQPQSVTFNSRVIQFNNRGEMRVTANLMRNVEIGLRESVNGAVRNPANYAAIQVQGLSGAVSLYRP